MYLKHRIIFTILLILLYINNLYSTHLNIYENDSLVCKNKKYLNGLDCSRWQGNIKWNNIDTIHRFIYIKATQSLTTDTFFVKNWKNCNIIKGAYHFFDPNINGIEQAKYFLSVVNFKKGNLPPVIDIEYFRYWDSCDKDSAAKNLCLMLEYIENNLCIKPIIYTNCNFWNNNVKSYITIDISKYHLWIANYTKETPCIPNGWNGWIFWQHTNKGRVKGHNTFWDLNYYNGSNISDILIK